MKPKRATSWQALSAVSVFVALVTGSIYAARLAARQHEELVALRQRTAQSELAVAALRSERDDTLRDLSAAELQLSKLPPPKAALGDIAPAQASEAEAWLGRAKELKRLFAENSARQIPELQLLTDADWLRVAKWAELDSDQHVRKTLALTRNEAKSKFARKLWPALQKFADTNHRLPSATAELAAYFTPPVDAALLDRYVVTNRGSPVNSDGTISMDHLVMEKSPVDADYDTRYQVGRVGFSRTEPPAWVENYATFEEAAWHGYVRANHGAWPTKRSELVPYFNPPLPQAAIDQLLQADRAGKR